jgi:hypothetical protein
MYLYHDQTEFFELGPGTTEEEFKRLLAAYGIQEE